MLELARVNDVVKKAASATLRGTAGIQSVLSETTTDSSGQEALYITVVLKRGSSDKVSGDTALSTLVSINEALRNAHEERLPIVDFVAEEEL